LFGADPFLLPHMQVDKGAIKFILSGANVMCPGLTSPGARMTDVQPETVVVSFYYSVSVPVLLYNVCTGCANKIYTFCSRECCCHCQTVSVNREFI